MALYDVALKIPFTAVHICSRFKFAENAVEELMRSELEHIRNELKH